MKRRIIQTFIVLCFGSILCVAPLGANNNLESDEQTETLLTVNTEQVIETEISIEQNEKCHLECYAQSWCSCFNRSEYSECRG